MEEATVKQYSAEHIRNIALAGHGGSGKTSLAEAVLFTAGATDRLGKIEEGNTVLDFDPEEKKRRATVSTAVASIEWQEGKINWIDTPGLFDFEGGVCEGMRAADAALIVISGKSGVTVGAEKAFAAAKKAGKPKAFFVSKLDSESADFYKVFNQLTVTFGPSVCPIVVPYVEERKVLCYVNLVEEKAYAYQNGKKTETAMPELPRGEHIRKILLEAVATADDELMDKYFSGEPFTKEEILSGLKKGVASGEICPVYCGSGLRLEGVDLMLDGLSRIMPSAAEAECEAAVLEGGEEILLSPEESEKTAAIVFKTVADPFVGKLNYFKVVSGRITGDSILINSRTGGTERIGKVMFPRGGRQEDSPAVPAGDIGAVAKLGDVLTGDTLCDPARKLTLPGIEFPAPCLSKAVFPKKNGDEEKLAQGLIRMMEEDKTITFSQNKETHQQILSGLGEQHLDVIVSKLRAKFGVEVVMETPRVAYRETIRKKVRVEGKHKKQTGGHGQFGHVWIEFEPCDTDDFVFEEKVVGGVVPKGFFPAVEKGLRECIGKGVLAGYPMVGLKATLVDGSYHPVDSSEMSFKLASALAYRAGIPQAGPVILEPIGMLTALMDDASMGDVIGEVNKRRGRVLGMNPLEDGMQELTAEVPMAAMGDFSTALRSITHGKGSYTLAFERYEEAPAPVAQKVIEEAKTRGDVE